MISDCESYLESLLESSFLNKKATKYHWLILDLEKFGFLEVFNSKIVNLKSFDKELYQ